MDSTKFYQFASKDAKDGANVAVACMVIAASSFIVSKLISNKKVQVLADKVAKIFTAISLAFIGLSVAVEIGELKNRINQANALAEDWWRGYMYLYESYVPFPKKYAGFLDQIGPPVAGALRDVYEDYGVNQAEAIAAKFIKTVLAVLEENKDNLHQMTQSDIHLKLCKALNSAGIASQSTGKIIETVVQEVVLPKLR